MARGWTCPRCSNKNGEGTLNCATCGLIRGGVVVQPSPPPSDASVVPPLPEWTDQVVGVPVHTWGNSPDQAAWVVATPAPQGPAWRRVPPHVWLLGLFLLLGGIGVVVQSVETLMHDAIRWPGGGIAKSGEMASDDLEVGDCWDDLDPQAVVFDTVIARPCSEAHENEFLHSEEMKATEFPTEDVVAEFVRQECVEAFGQYVGRPWADSALDITWVRPTRTSWQSGNRTIDCSIYDPNASRLTSSVRGANR